jgi:hypothetical protein
MSGKVFAVRPVAAGVAAAVPEVVKAERFEVVDKKGTVRARLLENAVEFWDESGKQFRAHVSLEGVLFVAAGGARKGTASYGLDGFTLIRERHVRLSFKEDDRLRVWSGRSKARADLSGGGLELYDEDVRSRAVLGVTPLETVRTGEGTVTAPSSLVLFDKEGKVIFKAPAE